MALVNIVNMVVLDNPSTFTSPFRFEITFECLQELTHELEWKVLYVGSAHDASLDQVLDEIVVGPVPVGLNKFVLEAEAPVPDKLPEILGVTVCLVTCSYREREFLRVGYYVNNELLGSENNANKMETDVAGLGFSIMDTAMDGPTPMDEDEDDDDDDEEEGKENSVAAVVPPPPPAKPFDLSMIDQVQRQILADKPRVTKFPIPWDAPPAAAAAAATTAPLAAATATNNNSII